MDRLDCRISIKMDSQPCGGNTVRIFIAILIHELKCYGIKRTALQLLQSYLSNRFQFEEYDNIMSDTLEISTGVPQGLVPGPLPFFDLYKWHC